MLVRNSAWSQVCLFVCLSLYVPLARGQNTSGSPVIFNISQSASAGDVIYIQGSGFGSSPKVHYSYNDSSWVALPAITSGSDAVMVQLPTSQTRLPDLLTVEVSSDGVNWSEPAHVNQTKPLSFDTNQLAPGSPFRVFGRNLMFSRLPTIRLVDRADGSSHNAVVNATNSKSYVLAAVAPSEIVASHTYTVYVSNAYNGNGTRGSEMAAPMTLQGRAAGSDYWSLGVPWAADLDFSSNVYNIQTDPRLSKHATGAGTAEDLAIIQAAVSVASAAGGGIVYLPAGSYHLHFSGGCGLFMPSRVVLMGEGVANTSVNFGYGEAPAVGNGGWAMCFVGATQAGASDITFNNVNQSGNWPQSVTGINSNDLFLQRTSWNLATAQWVVLQNNTNIAVENSNISQGLDLSYNGPLSVAGNQDLIVRNNTIKYVAGEINLDGATGGVIENNTFIRDASQSVPSDIVTHVIVGNFTNDLMVLNNSFSVTGGTLPTQNDGETVGTEAGGKVRRDEFRGVVQSATATSIYDANQNFNYSTNNYIPNLHVGAIVAIVGGTGAGQWAVITAISSDGHTLTVKKPWAVLPVNGSRYGTFDWSSANWIVAGNTLSDNEKGIEFFSASIRDILVANNTLTNNGEILVSPTEQPDGAGIFNLVLNTQITGNTLVDSDHLRPAAISVVSREDNENNNIGTQIIGLEVRGNSISGYIPNTVYSDASLDDAKALSEGLNVYWQWQSSGTFADDGTPSILGTILQGNTLKNSAAGLQINSAVSQTVLADNFSNNVGTPMVDTVLPGVSHGSVGTIKVATPRGNGTDPLVWQQLTIGSLPASTLTPEPASVTSFRLLTSDYQLGSGPDSLSMLAQQLSGDITVVARITIPSTADAATQGLLEFRADTSGTSAFLAFGQNHSGQMVFQYRAWDGGDIAGYTFAFATDPVWVKVVKAASILTAYYSSDGVSWQYGGEVGANLFGNYYVGLASLSDSVHEPAIVFDNVSGP